MNQNTRPPTTTPESVGSTWATLATNQESDILKLLYTPDTPGPMAVFCSTPEDIQVGQDAIGNDLGTAFSNGWAFSSIPSSLTVSLSSSRCL